MRVLVLSTLCAAALAGCGTDSPPSLPTAKLPFVTSATSPVMFNDIQGVLVGTSGYLTFGLSNIGSQTLTVQTVTSTASGAITLQPGTDKPLPAAIAYNDELLIGLTCVPTSATTYTGQVQITSNASNTPDIQ